MSAWTKEIPDATGYYWARDVCSKCAGRDVPEIMYLWHSTVHEGSAHYRGVGKTQYKCPRKYPVEWWPEPIKSPDV